MLAVRYRLFSFKALGRIGRGLILALTLFSMLIPFPAKAEPAVVALMNRQGAEAGFTIREGCIITNVGIRVLDFVMHNPPGPPQKQAYFVTGVSQFDNCRREYIHQFSYYGTHLPEEFSITGSKASTRFTVMVTDDITGVTTPLTMELNWFGANQVTQTEIKRVQLHLPECRQNWFSDEELKSAQTYGSVSFLDQTFDLSAPYWSNISRWRNKVTYVKPCLIID